MSFSAAVLMTCAVRPPKEERDRRAAEKRALLAKGGAPGERNGSEEDAEGEEE